MSMPYTVKAILSQMDASFWRVGGHSLGWNMKNTHYTDDEISECSCYPEKASSISGDGRVLMFVGLYFRVNTTRRIFMYVAYEPDDTYTVYLWQSYTPREYMKKNQVGKVLQEQTGVYCDELGAVVERMYDQYINEHQHGFIRL